MNYNILISSFVIVCCLFYIKYNETFYRFCLTYSQFKKKGEEAERGKLPFYLNETVLFSKRLENLEKYCVETNVRYESHTIMRVTINKINQFLLNFDILDKETFDHFVMRTDFGNLKLSLRLLKIIHIGLYVCVLYVGIIVIPNYIAQLALSLFNKILFLFFFILLGEAVMKIYFNWETDLITFIDKQIYFSYVDYIPIQTIVNIIKYIVDFIKNLI